MNIQEPLYKAINKDYGYLTFTTPLEVQDEINDLIKEIDPQTNGKGPLWSYAHIENQWSKPTPKILKQFILDLSSNFNYQDNLLNNGYLEDYYGLFYENKPDIVVGENIWFNFQKKGEFLPQHTHDGIYSYNIWLKIPYNIEDEYSKNPKHSGNTISSFQFTYLSIDGKFKFHNIQLTEEDEGTIIMFPAKLPHLVYPFYSTDKTRISIAGNILYDTRRK